jgi:hypothetical protein
MTETQNTEAAATTTYGEYGNRQDEFGYLSPESQAEIISYCHAVALLMDEARGMQVVTVTASGLVITRAMLDAEIAATRAPRPAAAAPVPVGFLFAAGLAGTELYG